MDVINDNNTSSGVAAGTMYSKRLRSAWREGEGAKPMELENITPLPSSSSKTIQPVDTPNYNNNATSSKNHTKIISSSQLTNEYSSENIRSRQIGRVSYSPTHMLCEENTFLPIKEGESTGRKKRKCSSLNNFDKSIDVAEEASVTWQGLVEQFGHESAKKIILTCLTFANATPEEIDCLQQDVDDRPEVTYLQQDKEERADMGLHIEDCDSSTNDSSDFIINDEDTDDDVNDIMAIDEESHNVNDEESDVLQKILDDHYISKGALDAPLATTGML